MEATVGIQVLVTAHNSERYLQSSLNSILPAIRDRPWVFIFNDDGSTDNTLQIAKSFSRSCGADHVTLYKSDKHQTVGAAKNTTFSLINSYRKGYPYICVHDSDDLMFPTRVEGLLNVIDERKCKFVHGDYLYESKNYNGTVSCVKQSPLLGFGVWATLFHESLVPQDGSFFRTDLEVFEDHAKWWDLRYTDKVDIQPAHGVMTNHYIKRDTSMTCKVTNEQIDKLKTIRANVYKHPLVT
ncbi:glycosyltransferase family 2 protein [bacterium]|nr:glycosyltransferase family 2 protein [bacterium]